MNEWLCPLQAYGIGSGSGIADIMPLRKYLPQKVDPQMIESMNGEKKGNTRTMMILLLRRQQIFRGVI